MPTRRDMMAGSAAFAAVSFVRARLAWVEAAFSAVATQTGQLVFTWTDQTCVATTERRQPTVSG